MASDFCAHGLRADEECEGCQQELFDAHGWPQDWQEARAWQAVRDFLNGTPDQWQKLMGKHVRNASALGYQNGYDNAMHEARKDD